MLSAFLRPAPGRGGPRLAALLALFPLLVLLPPGAAGQGEDPAAAGGAWDLGRLEAGKVYPTEVTAENLSCRGRHTFTVAVEGAPWLRITGPRSLRRIGKGEAKSTAAVVDTRGLPPGEHRGVLEIRCTTCPPPPVCVQNLSRIEVRLEIPATAGDGGEADGGCSCAELRALAEAAAERARRAAAAAGEAEEALEVAGEAARRAGEEVAAAEETRKELAKFFDDSSWIQGERGRITRGDLELLREARREVYDRWKAGEISAEEAAEAWEEIGPERLRELREEKRRELEAAREREGRGRKAATAAAAEAAEAEGTAAAARREAARAAERARRAQELYDACRARCRKDLLGRIADHGGRLEEIAEVCGPVPWEELREELEGLEEEAAARGEEVEEELRLLEGNVGKMKLAKRAQKAGRELPEVPTGLWDWGEDVGRAIGRPFGLEELGATAGAVASGTLGAVAEDAAGFPVGTDVVKAVSSAYKGVLGGFLHPDSVSMGRCVELAFGDEAQWKRTQMKVAWKGVDRLGETLAGLEGAAADLEARRGEIRELLGELRELGGEAPGPSGGGELEGASLEELRRREEELRERREEAEARCRRQQELLERLREAMAGFRSALGDIGGALGELGRINRGVELYREAIRKVGLRCL